MRNPKPSRECVGAKPRTLKEVGGYETLNPKRSRWVRNPATLKGVGECETLMG